MPVNSGRRLFLQSFISCLVMGQGVSSHSATRQLAVIGKWETGNTTLNPAAHADGVIYICGDQTLGAIAPQQPKPMWLRPHGLEGAAAYRPRLAGGLIICGGRKWIAALDRHTGETVWHYSSRIQTGVPCVSPTFTCFGDGHEIVAVDTKTGKLLWRFAGVPDTLASYAPVMAGATLLAAPGDGRLYALNLSDGKLIWSRNGQSQWQYLRQLHVDGDVLVGGSYKEKLFGISVVDGKQLWSFNAGNFINSHHVHKGSAYLWSPTGWVYAINSKTGKVSWRHQTTDYDETAGNWASLMAEIVVHNGSLYALAMDDVLHVLDTTTGDERLSITVPDRIRHAVLPVADQWLAFPTTSGALLVTEFV